MSGKSEGRLSLRPIYKLGVPSKFCYFVSNDLIYKAVKGMVENKIYFKIRISFKINGLSTKEINIVLITLIIQYNIDKLKVRTDIDQNQKTKPVYKIIITSLFQKRIALEFSSDKSITAFRVISLSY